MKRIWIVLLVLATAIAVGLPAAATPPKCDEPGGENLPGCGGDDEPTTTTTAPGLQACPTGKWTISGNGQTTRECLWKPINNGSPVATVSVANITGALSGPPLLLIRDDSPGDICVLNQDEADWGEPHTGPDYVTSFDLHYDTVPGPDYGAWLGQSYWGFVWQEGMEAGTHWCAPQDPIGSTIREDNNGGALHLRIGFKAKGAGSLDITLFPENSI